MEETYLEQRQKLEIARLKDKIIEEMKDRNDLISHTKRVINLFLSCQAPGGAKCAPNDSDFTEARKLLESITLQ